MRSQSETCVFKFYRRSVVGALFSRVEIMNKRRQIKLLTGQGSKLQVRELIKFEYSRHGKAGVKTAFEGILCFLGKELSRNLRSSF